MPILLTEEKQKVPESFLYTGEDGVWWRELVKRQKQLWMKTDTKFKGDMPACVLPEKEGKLLAFIIGPVPDKEYAFLAAKVCMESLGADTLTVITDGHIPLGKEMDVVRERLEKGTYRPGAMQDACDNEDACKAKRYTDCMSVHRVTKERQVIAIMTYSYNEKGDGLLTWTPEHDMVMGGMEGDAIGGTVPDTLNELIRIEPFYERPFGRNAAALLGIDPSRLTRTAKMKLFGDAGLRFLEAQDFTVFDFRTNPLVVS